MFEIVINDRFKPRRIKNFNDLNLTLNLDSIASVVGCSWLFDPEDKDHKNAICPSHFHELEVFYENEILLTGNLINYSFAHGSSREVAQISGYSRTGVLDDSTIPIGNFPISTSGQSIINVARKLCDIYKIKVVVDDSVSTLANSIIFEDEIQPSDTIGGFLKKITEPKGIIMMHNAKGDLVFTSVNTTKDSIFKLDESKGSTPITNVGISINGQGMHRYITVMQQADSEGANGGQSTIRNPYVINSYVKDKTVSSSSGVQDDMASLARMELSKELKNIKLSADASRWKINDKLILPGDIITVNDPNLYIYQDVRFVIDSVTYSGSNSEITCSFTALLIDVYTKGKVTNIYEGINIHAEKYD